jgi:hypothetical protein
VCIHVEVVVGSVKGKLERQVMIHTAEKTKELTDRYNITGKE